jgi:arylformamidase
MPAAIDPAAEREYNLRIRHPERNAVYERCAAASAELRQRERGFRPLRYGDSTNSVIDFFPAANAGRGAPLFLFVHGGYWRALDRSIFSFLAAPWLERGVHVALPGYDLAPSASVRAIAEQVERAARHLLDAAPTLGFDSARVIVSGHSAGAQLGALLLGGIAGWSARGFVGVSGVYDLEPLLGASVNLDIRLDASEARSLSPRHRPGDPAVRYLCAVGAAETDGFRRQTHEYAATLRAQGCRATSLDVPGRTHFDVLDDLADPAGELFTRAHAMLAPP